MLQNLGSAISLIAAVPSLSRNFTVHGMCKLEKHGIIAIIRNNASIDLIYEKKIIPLELPDYFRDISESYIVQRIMVVDDDTFLFTLCGNSLHCKICTYNVVARKFRSHSNHETFHFVEEPTRWDSTILLSLHGYGIARFNLEMMDTKMYLHQPQKLFAWGTPRYFVFLLQCKYSREILCCTDTKGICVVDSDDFSFKRMIDTNSPTINCILEQRPNHFIVGSEDGVISVLHDNRKELVQKYKIPWIGATSIQSLYSAPNDKKFFWAVLRSTIMLFNEKIELLETVNLVTMIGAHVFLRYEMLLTRMASNGESDSGSGYPSMLIYRLDLPTILFKHGIPSFWVRLVGPRDTFFNFV